MPRATKHKPSGTIEGVDLFTTQAAATMLRPPVSDRRVRALAASLGIGTRVGRAMMLTRADIDRLQNERRPAAGRPPAGAKAKKPAVGDWTPVHEMGCSSRVTGCLDSLRIRTIGELASTRQSTLLAVRGFGLTALRELKNRMADLGYSLADEHR